MADKALIDPRVYERLVKFIADYRLAEHDPRIALQLRMINAATPSMVDAQLFTALANTVGAFERYHATMPFPLLPSPLDGEIRVGTQVGTQLSFTLSDEVEHVLIVGPTGSGKSSWLAPVIEQLLNSGTRIVVLDVKGDVVWVQDHPSVWRFDALDWSPVATPAYSTPNAFHHRFLNVYREFFWGAELQHGAVAPRLETLHERSLQSLHEAISKDRSPAGKGAAQRLDTIRLSYPTIYESTNNLWTTLHDRSIYVDATGGITIPLRLLFWHLINERYTHRNTTDRTGRHTAIIIDEAPLTFTKRQHTISGAPPLPVQLLPLVREAGLQFFLASQSWNELDPLIIPQCTTQLIMTPNDGKELRSISDSLRLTKEQEQYASTMPRGTLIARRRGMPHPAIITFSHQERRVNHDAARIARERTINETRARPNTAPETPLSHNTRADVIAPNTGSRKVALHKHAEQLLRYCAQHGVILTSHAFRDLALHPQAGTRAKVNLLALALIEEARIKVHAGRGGTGVALRPTAAGYARSGVKVRGMRGGSGIQHEFLARAIARGIPSATLEARVGAKSVDILIPYNAMHARLARYCGISPAIGDLIGIEVDTTDKTVANNLARNTEAGVRFTIIATLTPLRRNPPGAIVVDVFELLEALDAEH